jgi:hypothetical protein
MKKITLTLAICLLGGLATIAEPIQEIDNNQAYMTANIQKQPKKDNKQKISNHFSFFVINIQINGKVDRVSDSDGK